MDLAGVDLVEQLHQHERVEDDGVVFGGRSVQGGVPPAVDVEQFLSCGGKGDGGEASGLFNDQGPGGGQFLHRFGCICEQKSSE